MFWIPNGAKPAGIFGSTKPPLVVTGTYWPLLLASAGPNTSTVPALKLVAKKKTPFALVLTTRALYTAPLAELSKAMTAWLGSEIVPAQAEIVPSSVSKIKEAAMFVPGTRNPVGAVVGFQTRPVGAAGVGGGG